MDKNKMSDSIGFWSEFADATNSNLRIDGACQLVLELNVFAPTEVWEDTEAVSLAVDEAETALAWAKLSRLAQRGSHKSKLLALEDKERRMTRDKEAYEEYVRDLPKNVVPFPFNKNK
jgi:hypothetical protein